MSEDLALTDSPQPTVVPDAPSSVKTTPPDPNFEVRRVVCPFVEVQTTLGPRTWIRKSQITGVDEVRASSWDDFGTKTDQLAAIVHTVGGKSWRISGDAAAFVASLEQGEL